MITIFTDTDTDITPVDAEYYGVKLISMPYIINEKEIKPYIDFDEFDYKAFYKSLRDGTMPKTCAINPTDYTAYFEKEFANGCDILYIHFSKAMSGTFNAMNIAVSELLEKYPERKFYTIDTKGITILSNIIIKEIGTMYKQGATIDEIMEWAEKEVDHFATYFFADTLDFFARSGRVSNFSKIMGNFIGIKPIIYMDDNGMMTSIGKVKGKNNALKKLCEYYDNLSVDPYKHKVIIGHTDSLDNATKLGEMLKEKYGEKLNIEYVIVNPTAGSHCGPDAVGIAFYAKHK